MRIPAKFSVLCLLALPASFSSSTVSAAGVADDDWLGVVNAYRTMSDLPPVVEHQPWSTQARQHSNYMLLNGPTHYQNPSSPGYTRDGAAAGMSGNAVVSTNERSTARQHVESWMTAPFHAIGILRPNLSKTGFGMMSAPSTPSGWKSAATLDVNRGNLWGASRPPEPIVFPGRGTTVPLDRFVREYPDPLEMCGWKGQPAGLPLVVMMPKAFSTVSASLSGPNGPVDVCVLHAGNTTGVASSVMGLEHAAVIVPNVVLAEGRWNAAVHTSSGSTSWSFTVDVDAPLHLAGYGPELPVTSDGGRTAEFTLVGPARMLDTRDDGSRLTPGTPLRVRVANSDAVAVSATFTAVDPAGSGFLTVWDCADGFGPVSTVNFDHRTAAVQSIVPTADGTICLSANTSVDVIVDVNAIASPRGHLSFVDMRPYRLFDTREHGSRVAAWEVREVSLPGRSGEAAVLNVTVVDPAGSGFVTLWDCDDDVPWVSNVNFDAGSARANAAIVGLSDRGTVCVRSSRDIDLVVDVAGMFDTDAGSFVPLNPIRLVDTRSVNGMLSSGRVGHRVDGWSTLEVQVAGVRGVPADANSVSLTVVAVDPTGAGFLTVFPCGDPPWVSNVNFETGVTVANGVNVGLSDSGTVCVRSKQSTHVVVDVAGVFKN